MQTLQSRGSKDPNKPPVDFNFLGSNIVTTDQSDQLTPILGPKQDRYGSIYSNDGNLVDMTADWNKERHGSN